MKKILIAEDEKPMAKALELKIKNSGFIPKVVYNGEEVLNALEQEKPDMIILDLIMPKKDGFTVLAEMQKRGDKTPVIVLSNLSQEEDAIKAKKLGAADYFIKTDTPLNELIGHIEKVLKSKSVREI